ncbi:MAG: sodium/solute symporter, partial [Candidatus Omnitrophica bacterium]|nr:sodium/solute symporter [Candidatus Omnitrophota bacterium]
MLYPLDWFAIFLYLAVLLGMGFFFYRKQDSTSEYFLAGRSLGWLPIGVSLMATLNSAVDYIVSPAQILEFGIWITLWSLIPAVIVYPFMVKFVLPFYAQLQLFSAYEYLERRFDVRVRSMTAFVFIVWRICWMAVAVYLPSFLLSTTTGLPVVPTVMVLGVIATLYTVMGGIRAVIWTDVMQCVVMFSGVSIALYLILSSFPGGVGEVIQVCRDEAFLYKVPHIQGVDATSSWWDWMVAYLHLDMTFTNLLIAGTIAKLAFYTVDQIMVQRYLTAKSVKASKDAFLCNTIAYVIYCLLFVALGMCLFTFYTIHPYPEGKTWDDMFPIFIAHELPVGIAGLVVAAIYAASMSSVDSGINSCTAVIYSDFVHRFGWMKPDDPKEYDRLQMRFL